MKATLLLAATVLGTGVSLSEPYGAPYYSVGSLNADRSTISNVSGPDIAWNIAHPETITDLVSYDAGTGVLLVRADVKVSAHIVGIGKSSADSPYRVGFWTSVGSGGWELKFDGTPLTQRASDDVLDRTLAANTRLALAGQSHGIASWFSPIASTDADGSVLGFAKGDALPAAIGQAPSGFLATYLTPQEGNPGTMEVSIGPKEMIFFFELPSESRDGATEDDFQDLVVLLSFEAL